MEMESKEVLALTLQFDGVAAVVRALVSELATNDAGLRNRLARVAGSDIRERMKDPKQEMARTIMMTVAAQTCGVPAGFLIGQ
jgi:hypothetical protein